MGVFKALSYPSPSTPRAHPSSRSSISPSPALSLSPPSHNATPLRKSILQPSSPRPPPAAGVPGGTEPPSPKPPPPNNKAWTPRVPLRNKATKHIPNTGFRVHMKKEKQSGIDFERIFEAPHIKKQVEEAIQEAFKDLAQARRGYLHGLRRWRRSRGINAQASTGRRTSFTADLRSALRVGRKRRLGGDADTARPSAAESGGAAANGRKYHNIHGGVPPPPIMRSFQDFCESPMMALLVSQVCIYLCGYLQATVANLDFVLRPRLDAQLTRIGDTYAQLLLANYGRPQLDDRAFFECMYHVTVTVVHEMLGHVVHLRQGYYHVVDAELGRLFRGPFACPTTSNQDPENPVTNNDHDDEKQRWAVAALCSSSVRPYPIYRHKPHFIMLASSIKEHRRQKAFEKMTVNNEKLATFAQQHIMRAFRVRMLVVKRWRKKQKSSHHGMGLPNMAEDGSSREKARMAGEVESAKDGARAAVTPTPTPPSEGHHPRPPKFTRAGRTLTKAQTQSPMVETYLRAINQTAAPPEEDVRQAQEVVGVGGETTTHGGGTHNASGGRNKMMPSTDGLMTVISRFHRRGAIFRGALP